MLNRYPHGNETMRRVSVLLLMLCTLVCTAAHAQRADREQMTMNELETRAELFVHDLFNAHLFKARSAMTDQFRRTMTEEGLRQLFGDLMMTSGRVKRIGKASAYVRQNGTVEALVPVELAQSNVIVSVVFERFGPLARISTFSIKSEKDIPASQRPAKPIEDPGPPYANKSLFKEETYRIEIGERSIPAVLTLPTVASSSARVPAVLLLNPGWGYDPDGRQFVAPADAASTSTVPSLITSRVTRDIAQGLASRGIAVLRYSDRAFEDPEVFTSLEYSFNDLVLDDAIAAAKALSQQPQVDSGRIVVAGLDLGGWIAPLVARTSGASGAALLQPWPLDLESGFLQNDEDTSASVWTSTFAPHLNSERFWFEIERQNPGAVLSSWNRPFLLMYSREGARDWQDEIARTSLLASVREYDGLHETFVPTASLQGGSPFAHVDERVIRDLAIFVQSGRLTAR